MSNAITVIAKTYQHAENTCRVLYGTLTTVPIRYSVEQAKEGLRGARNRIIYLIDLDHSEIVFFKSMHGSRNCIFVAYWQEPAS